MEQFECTDLSIPLYPENIAIPSTTNSLDDLPPLELVSIRPFAA